MIPKIIFRRSWIYEQKLAPLRLANFKMPADKEVDKNIKNLEKKWKKIGPKILAEIAAVTNLKWHHKETICYIVAGIIPFSDPLTIHPSKHVDRMIHTLTHEMIHRIFSEVENQPRVKLYWTMINRYYKKEVRITQIHIIVHAIHEHILRKFFNEKTLQQEVNWVKTRPYIRAWKIVQDVGYQNIIREFKKKLKK